MAKKQKKDLAAEAWCDRGLIQSPYSFCVCLTNEQMEEQMERCGVPKNLRPDDFVGNAHARLWTFEPPEGKPFMILAIRVYEDKTPTQIIALLVHECTHMKQRFMEFICEDNPSKEFEAYVMQSYIQEVLGSYDRQMARIKKKK